MRDGAWGYGGRGGGEFITGRGRGGVDKDAAWTRGEGIKARVSVTTTARVAVALRGVVLLPAATVRVAGKTVEDDGVGTPEKR
jgi:hypothetical protein